MAGRHCGWLAGQLLKLCVGQLKQLEQMLLAGLQVVGYSTQSSNFARFSELVGTEFGFCCHLGLKCIPLRANVFHLPEAGGLGRGGRREVRSGMGTKALVCD